MRTEKDKMLAGELYNASDPELVEERLRARELCQQLDGISPWAADAKLSELIGHLFGASTDAVVTPPFHCDYGHNITLGRHVYFNFNCVILDVAPVTIGDHVLFGPSVHVYTATHPLSAQERRQGLEYGRPVVIGSDVWIGGGSIVCPGVRIGDGAVIGAGSVVVDDVPPSVFAAGNPCRVIRSLAS